ncbi:hypothetical protein [Solimonas fluminis]|jgi:hypothetical protein|uniref:hypothetical protein n=1 Tax=Solimonas fluminis TaxID=2086571 RepID=UPI001FAE975B|nr:hypothetical protein [Solimonas fluminis]
MKPDEDKQADGERLSLAERRRKRRRERKQPLEVRMTMRFKFGDEADDVITMMDDRSIPMVDNVFKNRDKIVRGFVGLLVRAGLKQPKVAGEVFPLLKLLRNKRS